MKVQGQIGQPCLQRIARGSEITGKNVGNGAKVNAGCATVRANVYLTVGRSLSRGWNWSGCGSDYGFGRFSR